MGFRLKIRGKLILSFSAVMVLVLSGLGYITYYTFAEAILSHKQQIASLQLEKIRLSISASGAGLDTATLTQAIRSEDNFDDSYVLLSQGAELLLASDDDNTHQQLLQELRSSDIGTELTQVGQMYALHDTLPSQNLDLWYLIPEDNYLASLIELKNRVVVATIIILWASIWVVLIIAHQISRPIRHLSQATQEMQKSEYSVPLNYSDTGDEIGDLGQRFEDMRTHIEGLISRDPLSNLYNRRYLMHALEIEVSKAARHDQPLCCLMMDLDHFKQVNDNYGHQCGDLVIKSAAKQVQDLLRDYDICARYGGEEFIAILPMTSTEDGAQIAERIRQAIDELQIEWEGEHYSPTMSIGVAALNIGAEDPGLAMINSADEALYQAKNEGRNQVMVAPKAAAIELQDAANA